MTPVDKKARKKKKNACPLIKKNNGTNLAGNVAMLMFSSKTVNDLSEINIHSHRRLINVRRFTSV